LTALAASQEC